MVNLYPETPKGQTFVIDPAVHGTPRAVPDDAGYKESDKIRGKVAENMNKETLLCNIADFLRDYAPVLIEGDEITACKTSLVNGGILVGGRWKGYDRDPSDMGVEEVSAFNDIKPIVDAIFTYAGGTTRQRRNNYKFVLVPYNHLSSDISGINHKMDACIVEPEYIQGAGKKLAVRQCIVPNEYKHIRDSERQQKVREQILGDCHHILCDDVRRMFIYGLTIEDTRMSVWYFSRSHSMKALSFDWVEEGIDTFIHVFLAFAYASPMELGLDPLVHKAPIDPRAKQGTEAATQHYIYELNDDSVPAPKFFKTVQALNDQRPYRISGRITRIWKVIEVDSPVTANPIGSDYVVLKDVWLDADRATEAENLDNIMKAMEKLISDSKQAWGDAWLDRLLDEDKRFSAFGELAKSKLRRLLSDSNYKSLFLTKLHAWRGKISKPLSAAALKSPKGIDIFPKADENGSAGSQTRISSTRVESEHLATSSYPPIESKSKSGHKKLPPPKNPQKMSRHYVSKQQSRFVYKEVCSQLFQVKTLGNFMDLMLQADEALMILFCAGWVHRDISSGNLLAFRDNGAWKVKLADLEFAERLGHTRHRADPLTGTPFFMPHEIITRKHLVGLISNNWLPGKGLPTQLQGLTSSSPHYARLDKYKTLGPYGARVSSIPDTITSDIPVNGDPVRYNFQHDLEALWWIIVYYITACVAHEQSRDYAKLVFSQSTEVNQLRGDTFTRSFLDEVAPAIHPIISNVFQMPLEQLRCYLVEEYIAREVFGQLAVKESYSLIHNDFVDKLQGIMDNEDDDWKNIRIAPASALTGVNSGAVNSGAVNTVSKRNRDDDDDDGSHYPDDENYAPSDPKKIKIDTRD